MSTRTGEIGTYLMRGERKGETEGKRERKKEARERETFHRIARARISARREEIKGNTGNRGIKKKEDKKKSKYDAGDAICGIGRVAGPYTRKYPRC